MGFNNIVIIFSFWNYLSNQSNTPSPMTNNQIKGEHMNMMTFGRSGLEEDA